MYVGMESIKTYDKTNYTYTVTYKTRRDRKLLKKNAYLLKI